TGNTTTTTSQTAAQQRSSGGSHQQVRHATYVTRPRRPYQFTQLVQLSDGSTFAVRTTAPGALLKTSKDTRNHLLWQPSEKSLRNVEVDEAGKLAAFRDRFGRGWDLEATQEEEDKAAAAAAAASAAAAPPVADGAEQQQQQQQQEQAPLEAEEEAPPDDAFDSLVDLISGYAAKDAQKMTGMSAKEDAKVAKKK
ncbi:hypothetical protein B0T26DRAFT_601197, partial [Lasiosphaeria miniovina]